MTNHAFLIRRNKAYFHLSLLISFTGILYFRVSAINQKAPERIRIKYMQLFSESYAEETKENWNKELKFMQMLLDDML